uniref:Uncharacterized protein n=1 Tax=Sphaerodactylus townsendi TaxID=933632 RepID=A0ACB8GB82_9SAUR
MSSSIPPDAVGRRILCNGEYGTVLYVGNVPPTTGIWLGVEWDNHQRGKHNGTHEGIQYFECRHPTGGSFIRPNRANFGIDFLSAVRERYGLNDGEQGTENETESLLVIGRKTVERVGFDSIKEKQKQLNKLNDVSVDECTVSLAGPEEEIRKTCPNSDIFSQYTYSDIRRINLSKNLLSSWMEVIAIACQAENLEIANLSQNKMKFPATSPPASGAFCKLRVLALNQTGVTWAEVLLCATGWLALEELYLASNEISVLQRPTDVLQSLKWLDLSEKIPG